MTRALVATVLAVLSSTGCASDAEVLVDVPYHRPGQADATNLVVRDAGVFEWKISGCDYSAGDIAMWEFDGDVVEVRPDGAAATTFPDSEGIVTGVTSIVLTPVDGGEEVDVLVRFDNRDDLEQSWDKGGVCPQCGAAGPTGQEACDDPFGGCAPEPRLGDQPRAWRRRVAAYCSALRR